MWSLKEGKKDLKPKVFSNNKNQEDIVKEVVDAIHDGERVIFIHGVCGSGKCLEKDTLIFCKPKGTKYFGYHKISDLENNEGKIMALDKEGNTIESIFKNVRETGKKKIFRLKTTTGREILLSENHPLLTIDVEGIKWKPLMALDTKSFICLPNRIVLNNKYAFGENKVKVLAHLIAEGKLGDKNGSPKYYQCKKQNPEIRRDYEKALQSLFPEGQLRSYSDFEVSIIFNNRNTKFGTTNKLRLFIREFGLDGKKSNEKFVPPIIFNLDNKERALFLKTLYSCDGSIYTKKSRNKKQPIIEYCSISKRLIKDMSILLSQFGIQHTITSKGFRGQKEYSWRINISNQKQIMQFIEQIGFIGRKQRLAKNIYLTLKKHKFTNIDKVPRVIREYLKNKGYSFNQLNRFLNYEEIEQLREKTGFKKILKYKLANCPLVFRQQKINFLRTHLRKVNEHINDPTLSFVCNEDLIWDKVKSIELIKEDLTYDLEVPNYHNFIANGIIVHNSAIALNIAKEIGRASIVVPIKNLQKQYEKDYTADKQVLKDNNEKLKITMITGRSNHKCAYLNENVEEIRETRKIEVNAKLNDIFKQSKENLGIDEVDVDYNESADNHIIPCKIEIKDKNMKTLKKYYQENPHRKNLQNLNLKFLKRLAVGPACPYWSPILPADLKVSIEGDKQSYQAVGGEHCLYLRKPGCKYYEQFKSYITSDVIMFNSAQYMLETLLGRKPCTDIEIIDECDEFLDNLATEGTINIKKLRNESLYLFPSEDEERKLIDALNDLLVEIARETKEYADQELILPINQTKLKDLITLFSKNDYLSLVQDEDSYIEQCSELCKKFYDFLDEGYVSFYKAKDKEEYYVRLVTINLDKVFSSLLEKNKVFVMMSGTLHSERVLKEIFGINEFKIIEAETANQGTINKVSTGLEKDFKYENFRLGNVTRKDYLTALDACVEKAKKPCVVHVCAFQDLPSKKEFLEFNLHNTITREELIEQQNQDKTGKLVSDFKTGQTDILFTTKCNRGIDFPFETCNSVIITKFPYPNTQSLFWRILKKQKPSFFWDFYKDKAHRELMQRIYRSLRAKDDCVELLSPDIRVLNSQIV